MSVDWGFLTLLLYPAMAVGLYWLVRLAVRHGIQDADRRRAAPFAEPRAGQQVARRGPRPGAR